MANNSFQSHNIDNISFMNLVEQHRCLYMSSEKDQKSRDAKDEAWRAIAKQIGEHVTTDDVIRRYKNIRTSFGRFLRENVKNTDDVKIHSILENSSWSYLTWLQPYIKHKFENNYRPPLSSFTNLSTTTNTNSNCSPPHDGTKERGQIFTPTDTLEHDRTETYNPDYEHNYQAPKEKYSKNDWPALDPNIVVRTLNTLLQRVDKESDRKRPHDDDEDEDVLFLKSLIPQLKRIPPSLKFAVKTNILKILHDGEYGVTSE